MKLQRFIAATQQCAIQKINEILGSEALIYTTKRVPEGVEILAGLPFNPDEVKDENETNYQVEEVNLSNSMFNKLDTYLNSLEERLAQLSKKIDMKFADRLLDLDDETSQKKSLLNTHLRMLGFHGKFTKQYVNDFIRSKKSLMNVDEKYIISSLTKYIKTEPTELIDEKRVIALVGPTGVGKTSTIAKLAKRYVAKYGAETIGLITMDYQDVKAKNILEHYSKLLQVDLQYANDAAELNASLSTLQNKNLILIDTQGTSQRDKKGIERLLTILEEQNQPIDLYLTLPCNIQVAVFDEITYSFKSERIKGVILTKQDESISITPVLSVCMSNKLAIAYICDGQDINTNIAFPSSEYLLQLAINNQQIALKDSLFSSKMATENLVLAN